MDQLTSEELAKKLFNRKSSKKKNDAKDLDSLKEENISSQARKKTNFNKITKQSSELQRPVIFKKSLAE